MEPGEADENAQRALMSDADRAKLLASKALFQLCDFDYSGARDAAFYRRRCEKLGYSFPDSYYEAFALYDSGVRAKQYRAQLKKAAKRTRVSPLVHPRERSTDSSARPPAPTSAANAGRRCSGGRGFSTMRTRRCTSPVPGSTSS